MANPADVRASFAIDLESNASEVAPNAAAALEQLRDQIRGGIDELRGMQSALRNMRGAAAVSRDSIKELQDRIAAQRAVIGQAQERYLQLGGSFRQLRPQTRPATVSMSELTDAMRAAPGPLSSVIGRLGSLRALVAGGAIAGGIAGIAAALTAITVASTAAAAAIARYGIIQADARRTELLRLEGLSQYRNYWLVAAGFTRAADSAEFLQSAIDSVSDKVALGRDQILGYADSLYRAGLRGGALQEVLEGMSIVAATQGEAAATQWRSWAIGAAMAGASVKRLTDDVRARLGPIAQRQLLSLGVQLRKLREDFSGIFADVRVEGMLSGIRRVTELFSQTTSSGRALRTLAATWLSPFADAIGSTGTLAKDFFRGLILAAQDFTISMLEVRLWFKRTFGDIELLKGIDTARLAVDAGRNSLRMLAGAFESLIGVLGSLDIGLLRVVKSFITGANAIYWLVTQGRRAYNDFVNIDWPALGQAVIDGIVDGIRRGVQWVRDAINDIASTVQQVFSQKLRIRSPSKVMFDAGVNIDVGLAHGIASARPLVVREVHELAAAPARAFVPTPREAGGMPARPQISAIVEAAPPPAQHSPVNTASRSGPLVVIEQLTVQATGADASSHALSIRRELERVLEGLAIELGAEVAA